MEITNLNLVGKNGNKVASVELSDRAAASEYFGTWYKADPSASDVVKWCDDRIKIYKRFIANLEALRNENRIKMCEGIDIEVLKSILEQKEKKATA